ncbi:hypothetical protein F4781DRAFT_403408 [Annulohypoxylon bovei var. microspora]|nr:hypothetical protein F4781DRAFT_403408 [Annulohypoxylon bovei var. microspora]
MISRDLSLRESPKPSENAENNSSGSSRSRKRQFDAAFCRNKQPAKKQRSRCRNRLASKKTDPNTKLNGFIEDHGTDHGTYLTNWLGSNIESNTQEDINEVKSIPESTKEFLAMASTHPASFTTDVSKSTHDSITSSPTYRVRHLHPKGIRMVDGQWQLPDWVQKLTDEILQVSCLPNVSHELAYPNDAQLKQRFRSFYKTLFAPQIYFIEEETKKKICMKIAPLNFEWMELQSPNFESLVEVSCQSFTVSTMTNLLAMPSVAKPIPDLLYGYATTTFPRLIDDNLSEFESQMICNRSGVFLPYMLVEFKSMSGNLWQAANQCMGGSAVCLQMVEEMLGNDHAVFSVGINGKIAQIYVMWSEEQPKDAQATKYKRPLRDHLMYKIATITLDDLDGFSRFWRILINIHNWAGSSRLERIKRDLDEFLDKSTTSTPPTNSVSSTTKLTTF